MSTTWSCGGINSGFRSSLLLSKQKASWCRHILGFSCFSLSNFIWLYLTIFWFVFSSTLINTLVYFVQPSRSSRESSQMSPRVEVAAVVRLGSELGGLNFCARGRFNQRMTTNFTLFLPTKSKGNVPFPSKKRGGKLWDPVRQVCSHTAGRYKVQHTLVRAHTRAQAASAGGKKHISPSNLLTEVWHFQNVHKMLTNVWNIYCKCVEMLCSMTLE